MSEPTANDEKDDERRTSRRCRCSLAVTSDSTTTAPADAFWGKIDNLSAHGIGLVLDRRFDPETALRVEIQTAADIFLGRVTVRVIHVTARDAEWYHGCTVVPPPDPASE